MARTLTSRRRRRLVLLDTHAIIHRAYHALPEFTGPDGSPTGALYGLVAMLIKIVKELEPDYIAACYDLPGPTVRHEAYEAYKGTRAALDDALALQIERSREVFAAFSIPVYEKPGFEADDILGTIAKATKGKVDVVIASGDMDMLQLVDDDRVRVYTLKKGLNDTIIYDEAGVVERFGFGPMLIPDLKSLMGDPSDNIKGVPGVGEGSALKLVAHYGALEKLIAALKKKGGVDAVAKKSSIQKRYAQLVFDHEEDARFSKALATIRTDAPIAFALPALPWREHVDLAKALALLDTMGFRSLRDRAKQALGASAQVDESPDSGETVSEPVGGAVPKRSSIAPERFAEAKAMLWLISSDFTNSSVDDILAFAKASDFNAAYEELTRQISALGRVRTVYEEIEKPLVPIIAGMEEYGVLIDPKVLEKLARTYGGELAALEEKVFKEAGRPFNISSPKQLGEVLFDELGLVPDRQKKTAGGQRSTRESELEKIRELHPIVGDVLEYRELRKLLSTYIENLPPLLGKDNRLHAEFIQTGAATGRMASANPNLQNIPLHSRRGQAIRHAFIAPTGSSLVALDYSQIELRLAAILSGDDKLCDIFRNGRDVHREVASYVFHIAPGEVTLEMRRRAKVINFGILYGMGVNALRQQLGATTAEAHAFYDEYFGQFKTLSEYLEQTKGFARKMGYTETLFGRRRHFPEMKSSLPYVRAQAERMAINAPIQGTQADVIKLAMVAIDRMLSAENLSGAAHLLLQVHDELVYEIGNDRLPTLAVRIKGIMEGVLRDHETYGVPIDATMKIGPDWGSLEAA